ncbi:MAG: retropepsin-like domain-containing protein [Alphaproteobacteria bacterium]|nr:retropepsin-like domain-containing protein [Alphaproteobacteria bacterium]MCB9791251.1 retropepsin-like domain-containing protein [Alphaproteobacteria bacterium]
MRGLTLLMTVLLSLPGLSVAVVTLLGVGVLREVPGGVAAIAAVGVGVLPALGLGALWGRQVRPEPLAVGMLLWPLLVLLGLPFYFPGEREEAMATGMALAASPWGPEASARGAALGQRVSGWLGEEPEVQLPPPAAVPLEDEPQAIASPAIAVSTDHPEDEIALPYEGAGRSLVIPVTFEAGETRELSMLYDTGATYTTLSEDALRSLGARVSRDAPEITMRTANGERSSRLVLLDRVWLGGFEVEGVTVAVCDECADEDSAGLLGLNVTGRFTVTVDPSRRELVLKPRGDAADRKLDIGQWLKVSGTATAWSDGRVVVELAVDNEAPREVAEVVVGVHCQGESFKSTILDIAPGGTGEERVSLPRGTDCSEYRISVESASW